MSNATPKYPVPDDQELWDVKEPTLASKRGAPSGKRLLRYNDLEGEGCPYSRQTLTVLEREGRFPKRIRLSPRVVVWDAAEVRAWLADRRARRG